MKVMEEKLDLLTLIAKSIIFFFSFISLAVVAFHFISRSIIITRLVQALCSVPSVF